MGEIEAVFLLFRFHKLVQTKQELTALHMFLGTDTVVEPSETERGRERAKRDRDGRLAGERRSTSDTGTL